MELLLKAFGPPQTNCYLLKTPTGDYIIDPGIGASQWVLEHSKQPLAILITHGHYDHIWSVAALKSALPNVPVYSPKEDAFMLHSDCFGTGLEPCNADFLIAGQKGKTTLKIGDLDVSYWHFPGHTPGCSMIEINDMIFSGDFIFYRSIGRYDFPYSNPADMKESLLRFQKLPSATNKTIYPGHGEKTFLFDEQANASLWAQRIYT
ncbi:MBL fold metallo-hydrolase [Helicobacter sp. 11S02596-1]|uniref:MBL fold metallo-hydrolase n=1 Tax=Helicobacter sp. 11S02596-1 TaxID=1476194 RepID=UPI000BA5A7EA|nr:MBL fold metallo-hydrolase [Helicobacter sp. 11S02596-1]PAF44233.1 MBL fold metallo-hydrolase [Helicobacter sp. 11S02596-1]